MVNDHEELASALVAGDRRALARAITLVESTRADHRAAAVQLLGALPGREALRIGLEAAVADGSFQRLHREFYGAVLKAHPVSPGQVLRLSNPLLPAETPLRRRELWLQPGETG